MSQHLIQFLLTRLISINEKVLILLSWHCTVLY